MRRMTSSWRELLATLVEQTVAACLGAGLQGVGCCGISSTVLWWHEGLVDWGRWVRGLFERVDAVIGMEIFTVMALGIQQCWQR